MADRALEGHSRLSRAIEVARGVVHEQSAERVGLVASGAAFWLVISIFPTGFAAISLFGLVVSPERVAADLGSLATGAPSSLSAQLDGQLHRVAASDHAGLSMGLALSVVLAIWSASAGAYNLDRAIRVAYGLAPQSYLEGRESRALLGAIVVVLTVGAGALGISIVVGHSPGPLIVILGLPVVLIGITGAVAFLYWFSVEGRVKVRLVLPGAHLISGRGGVDRRVRCLRGLVTRGIRPSTASSRAPCSGWLRPTWRSTSSCWVRCSALGSGPAPTPR